MAGAPNVPRQTHRLARQKGVQTPNLLLQYLSAAVLPALLLAARLRHPRTGLEKTTHAGRQIAADGVAALVLLLLLLLCVAAAEVIFVAVVAAWQLVRSRTEIQHIDYGELRHYAAANSERCCWS